MELTNRLRLVEEVLSQLEIFYMDRGREERDRYLAPVQAYRWHLLSHLEKMGSGCCEGIQGRGL